MLSISEVSEIKQVFDVEGLLAQALPGYQPRAEQLEMVAAVSEALTTGQPLVVEAGTGTGKTFAYLVPALLSRQKTIISTGTKNLQDQLYYRDLPFIQGVLNVPVKTAILKGRSNYLCRYRIEQFQDYEEASPKTTKQMATIVEALPALKTGEITEISALPEDSPVWQHATSTVDNCLGQECPLYNECFLVKARREAMEADVLVINHHLFFADALLKQDSVGELLPKPDVTIFDEAHQIPEVASNFFGKQVSSRQIFRLFTDVSMEWAEAASDQTQVPDVLKRMEHLVYQFHAALGPSGMKKPWQTLKNNAELADKRLELLDEWDYFIELLAVMAERSKGLAQCYSRASTLRDDFATLTDVVPNETIHWFETFSRSFIIHHTPLAVSEDFSNLHESANNTWIFTSATLSIGHSLGHFIADIGILDAKQCQLNSPFDYQKQALLYVPRYLPDPKHTDYTKRLIDTVLPIVTALEGRTLFLFTSYHALNKAEHYLTETSDLSLLVQGEAPKDQLINRFRQGEKHVLLATASFWEGVDIKGSALSCVIIDKLPFANLDDPVLQARMARLRELGQDPFQSYQLPKAAMSLKQGAGRLIRDVHDKGILVIGDPRLLTQKYSQLLVSTLPAMRRTRDEACVHNLIEEMDVEHISV